MHIVFHEHYRDVQLLVDVSQDRRHLLGLFRVHPRHWLVQQQHIGGRRQSSPQLHPLLRPVGQQPHRQMRRCAQAEQFHKLSASLAMDRFLPPCPPEPNGTRCETRAHKTVAAQHEIVGDIQVVKKREILECAGNASASDCHRSQPCERLPIQRDAPDGRHIYAADAVEQRRLARSVRPDDSHQLAGPHREADIFQDRDAAHAEAHILYAKFGGHAASAPASPR